MVSLYTVKSLNVRKSIFLIAGFLIFVIALGWLISQATKNDFFIIAGVAYAAATSLTGYFYSDKIVLGLYGAQEASRQSNTELYRIVENLAVTAGIPTPKIFIVPEDAPNAFATGRNPKTAVVAVTQGLLNRLDKTELEGVISHELSHILNRDTLVATLVVILAGVVATISHLFLRSLYWSGSSRRRDNEKGAANQLFLALAILGALLAPLAAVLIQLAISRRREFLADSNGALITRYPEGLINALVKISSDPQPMRKANDATAHLWFDDPVKGKNKVSFFHKLFMTHPPVEERIKALRGMKV